MPWTTEKMLMAIQLADDADCITEAQLAEASGLTAKQIENAVAKLVRYGFIKRTAKGCHKLTDAGRNALSEGGNVRWRSGPKGQHTGQRNCCHGLRQRAWNVLRLGGKRTVDDIAMRACEGDERDPRSNVRKYLKALQRAGYVTVMGQREAPLNTTSNGCLRYLLVNDTGPHAPVWNVSRKSVYDPNTETITSIDPDHAREAA